MEEEKINIEGEKLSQSDTCILFIKNSLYCEVLAEVKIDDEKTQLHMKPL
jgi:hypothetical protein